MSAALGHGHGAALAFDGTASNPLAARIEQALGAAVSVAAGALVLALSLIHI